MVIGRQVGLRPGLRAAVDDARVDRSHAVVEVVLVLLQKGDQRNFRVRTARAGIAEPSVIARKRWV